MASKSGGGITSRNVKQVSVRTGAAARGINPHYPSSLGSNYGNHTTGSTRVLPNPAPGMVTSMGPAGGKVPLGNATALAAGQGPGAGRSVSRCGSQQGVSPSTPIGPTKDTLAGK
jgi:hypothetical protein